MFNPFLVFVGASVVVTIINLACCSWLNREWSSWIAEGHGKRVEPRLARMRESKVMRHPADWIISGSDAWFTLGAMLINPVVVVGIARLVGGQPVTKRRFLFASIAYSVFVSLVLCALGLGLGDGIRAI